jgi:hypothetical protein
MDKQKVESVEIVIRINKKKPVVFSFGERRYSKRNGRFTRYYQWTLPSLQIAKMFGI